MADTLSRSPVVHSILLYFDYNKIARDQQEDPDLTNLADSSLKLEHVPLPNSEEQLLCEMSTGHLCLVLPHSWTRPAFDLVHNLNHPGVKETTRQLSTRFVWNNMTKQVALWARQCLECQTSKVTRHTAPPNLPFPITSSCFQHIHIDLVGPLKNCQGFTHIFTIIDQFTRWLVAVPVIHTTSVACARALLHGWVSSFGIPSIMTSDRDPQFVSAIWKEVHCH